MMSARLVVPASSIGLEAVGRAPGGELILRVTGEPGREYILEASADLVTWVAVKTFTLSDATSEMVDAEARPWPRRFYRVRLAP